ncbi:HAMP domain-containing histidine kinase [Ornithinimicrobium sp. F0845]|uniref:sensor histidine kinase n=1 Tax=Ornithinimicrobium sp. F0845 TaxID=2926412 RepID=UPI001FF36D3D|nr:HAMP domain-containing sensor histidine kinase [Ornithinimicrobium sp. F0845]MCK0113298.1 HAMP domain-containing histidine kinase [Ornithinimicrobium sp. F0845]
MIRPRRLSTTLVLVLVALFLVVTAATAVTTVLLTRQQLVEQLDTQLTDQARFINAPQGGGPGDRPAGDVPASDVPENDLPDGPGGPPPGGISCSTPRPGVGEGMLQACFTDTTTTGHVVSEGAYQELGEAQLAALLEAGGPTPTSVDLEGAGTFRVIAAHAEGATIVTGVPMTTVDKAVANLVRTVVLVSLAGTVLTALGGALLISRSLRPLVAVASTARDVSAMDLSRGEVHLPDRVPPALSDGRTEVGQVGRALNSLLDNVGGALTTRQRSETRLRTFVADASHELRTPLASIRGYAELSRRQDEPVPTQVGHALERIESEATRMTDLVEDLLLLARLDAGRALERTEVDLSAMVVESVADAHAADTRGGGPQHHWELALPDKPVTVIGDAARLKQVLSNLLGNARTHTPPGTRVVVSLAETPDAVLLSVVDDGPGIPLHQQDELFERFTRGDTSRHRATGSTGLGLSIVRAVVEAHGGTVDLHPQAVGTALRVWLPRGSTDHTPG